ncbi:S-crystallin [Trema orientale]|uniref:S-crystallin n=1 Tax=Trema orientale TaxID=63057 RepID=A0A2P5EEK2_TREOI|nr:S-crystallin [Trema orientale]
MQLCSAHSVLGPSAAARSSILVIVKPWLWSCIHSALPNKNAFKSLIVAEHAGVKIEVAANFELGVTNKTPEFLKMNPIGKIPVLETPDGPTFEIIAISRYGFTKILTKSFTSEFPHVERYLWALVNQPNFKKILGEVVNQTESIPPLLESATNDAKPNNPLDLLPPSKMILDEWKRL